MTSTFLVPLSLLHLALFPPHRTRSICWGKQSIPKFNETVSNVVELFVCVFRFPSITTDVVISLNNPVYISPSSSSASAVDVAQATVLNAVPVASALFKDVVDSFVVRDFSIFGPSGGGE